ncbi:MAG: DUF4838 domain-containing protein [Bacteroides sp.]
MKKRLNLCIIILLLTTVSCELNAQVSLVKEGKPMSRIVTTDSPIDNRAARLLQDFVSRITHVRLPIVMTSSTRKNDVIIGVGDTHGLTEDGFRLATNKHKLYISSGGDKGSIYGVVTLLEKYMGVSYYAAHCYHLEKSRTLTIPSLNLAENPTFRYRQSQNYALSEDSVYKDWFRLEDPQDAFVKGYWVHTFNRLLPVAEFGETHPEYYSFINGQRRPGNASQLCLTNPEVLEIIAHRIDSIFKANPKAKIISVSQNDGNDTYCTCPTCRSIDEYEGSPTGSLIHFINQLAKRFPDKEFSTLAYQYTMHPPKHIKPLPNVNIMLCNIDCRREVPLTDNASGRNFVKAMEGWAGISNNIFVWDYGINFDNYLVPFPNFPILQQNIKLFKKHHATMHFSQIAGSRGGDFSEMRTYMVSKLMWNSELNADSLMRSFMDHYYGAASPYIYQYEKLLEGALLASNTDLWIYDTPLSHKNGMLNKHCRKRYNELFDQAEAAVATDQELLNRVRLSRLPLQYSDLEMARVEQGESIESLNKQLRLFGERTDYFKVTALNERNNTPKEYCLLYPERYLPNNRHNLAKEAEINWVSIPAEPYKIEAETVLTDEQFSGDSSKEPGWIGWQGTDAVFTLDMKEVKEITSIQCDFIQQLGQWSLFPQEVTYSYSVDNQCYNLFGKHSIAEDRSPKTKFYQAVCTVNTPVQARYIHVVINSGKVCPGWHFGAGHPSWFFIDEITVR